MGLRWRLKACSDLSGCWLEATNFRDEERPEDRAQVSIERAHAGEDPGYVVWFELAHGTPTAASFRSPSLESIEEAKAVAESMFIGYVAGCLVEMGLPPEEMIR